MSRIEDLNLFNQDHHIFAAMGHESVDDAVLRWYQTIFSRHVDLVGDYAGSELFLIEFDSLLLRCFSNRHLNFSSKYL
jgi:hypothetical protein